MILIDEHVEAKLVEALEQLRPDPKLARCITLRPGAAIDKEILKQLVVAQSASHPVASDAQLYVCEDGDIFILAPSLPVKIAKDFIWRLASSLQQPASDDWVMIHELSLSLNKLLFFAQQKIDVQRRREETERARKAQLEQEHKRQAILGSGQRIKSDAIKARRANRQQPELMMIEDDAFSRRLVENVIQKKYPMTGLGEATHALETYAQLAPDLLFLDINLPDVTGHELLEKILALDPDACVVMLSGSADKENITHAMSRGAKGFIAKPFTKEKIIWYLDRFLTIQHA